MRNTYSNRRAALSNKRPCAKGAAVAQVVCQVIRKPGRMSILWSAESTAFEPIHLEGDALTSFDQAARRGRQALAEAALGNSETELVEIGRDLHRRFFPGSVGAEVAGWLRANVETLEIGADAPGRIPFAIFDDPDQPGPWGRRFALSVGRRVSPMRTAGQMAASLAVAVDAAVRDELNDASRAALDAFVAQTQAMVVSSRLQLKESIERSSPDVIWLLTRLEGGKWLLGGERLGPQELRASIREAEEGNPLPLVVSTGVAGADAVTSWECFLSAATAALPGFVSLETPARANAACDIGLSLLTAFLVDKLPIAQSVQKARLGAAGLSLATYAPPIVRVDGEDTTPSRPLPDAPYHPLRPLEREDRALLFGRDDDIEACAVAIDQPNVAGLLIHGRAGIGRASLVRAGVLPFLEEENRGFYVLRDRTEAADNELDQPTLALRTGPDLAGSLVMGLTSFAARPFTYTTPTGRTVTVDLSAILLGASATAPETAIQDGERGASAPRGTVSLAMTEPSSTATSDRHDTSPRGADAPRSPASVWDQVRDDPAAIADLIDRLTRDLPFDLLIPLEQLEDVVTLPTSKADAAGRVLQAIAKSAGRFHVVATLRTECLGEIQPLLGADYARTAWKDYYLDELTEDAVNDALLAPTKAAIPYGDGSPAATYQFDFAPGMATKILTYVKEQIKTSGYSAIQLVHAFGGELFDSNRAGSSDAARQTELDRIVKKGVVESLVERKLKQLEITQADVTATRGLVASLHRVSGRIVTRDLVPVEAIERKWRSTTPAQQVLNRAVERGPLLEAHNLLVGGKERLYVALPQDLLANYGDQQERQKAKQNFARSKTLDSLFIFVPLTVLAMAMAFFVISKFRARAAGASEQTSEKTEQDKTRAYLKGREEAAQASRFALYPSALATADALIQQGNTLRARQWLATQQPQSGGDLRGFEWFYLWKKINGEEANFVGHKAQARLLAMSADGKLLASGDEAGNILLWNLEDLKEPLIANLKGLKGPVTALAVAPDGSAIAGSDGGTKVAIWDAVKPAKTVADVEPKTILATEGKGVTCIAFAGAGSLAVGDEDKSVTLWDVAEKKAKWTGRDHTAPVTALTAMGDDAKIVSASDKELIAWTNDGKNSKTEPLAGDAVAGLAPLRNDAIVVAGSKSSTGSLEAWYVGKKLASLGAEPFKVRAVAVVPTTKLIAVAGDDQVISLIPESAAAMRQPVYGHVSAVRSLAGGGTKLASVGYDNAIKIWDTSRVPVFEQLYHDRAHVPVVGLALDDRERVLVSGGGNAIAFWDAATNREIGRIALKAPVSCIALSAQSKPLLLAAGVGNDVMTWEIDVDKDGVKSKELATLKKHTAPVTCLAFDVESNKFLASGSADKTAVVWELPAGKDVRSMKYANELRTLWFAAPVLISGDADGLAQMWKITEDRTNPPIKAHFAAITALGSIAIDKRGWIITSSLDQTTRIWGKDPAANRFGAFGVYRAHYQPVTALAQGKNFFVTGAADGTVKTWDPTLEDERFTFKEHKGPVRSLIVGKNNDFVASAGDDGTIVVRRGIPQPKGFMLASPPASAEPGHEVDN